MSEPIELNLVTDAVAGDATRDATAPDRVHLLDGRAPTVEKNGVGHKLAWCGVNCVALDHGDLELPGSAPRSTYLPDKATCPDCIKLLAATGYFDLPPEPLEAGGAFAESVVSATATVLEAAPVTEPKAEPATPASRRAENATAPWAKELANAGRPAPRGPDSPAPWQAGIDKVKGIAPATVTDGASSDGAVTPGPRSTFSAEVVVALNQIPKLTSLREVEDWVDANPEAASLCGMLPSFSRFMPDSMPSPNTLMCCDDEVMVVFRRGPDGRFVKSRLSR